MSLTRAIKFEVEFRGLRKADRLELYQRLWGLQGDITRACNVLISCLWQLKLGHLVHPTKPDKTGEEKPIALRTLAYQGLSGAWQPHGHPLYSPYEGKGRVNPRASGGVLSETANVVLNRLQTDFIDCLSGKKSLPTFREMPISYRASETEFREDGGIELVTFNGRRNNRISVWPRKLDDGQRAIFNRLRDGTYKTGCSRLQWIKRKGGKGRWMISIAWTDEKHEANAIEPGKSLVAGIDLGIEHAVWIAYTDLGGVARRFNDTIEFPGNILRSIAQRRRERTQRSRWNRDDFGLRTGRGRGRKMRVVNHLSDTVVNTHDTMIRQLAAATVKKAIARGATVIVLEDHKDWSVERMHEEADQHSKKRAAQIRHTYFRWHQGAMRVAIQNAAEKAGLTVLVVDPAMTSRTCSACGTLWADTGVYRKGPKPEGPEFGRIELRKFVCSCGTTIHADRNAAINIARRGIPLLEIAA